MKIHLLPFLLALSLSACGVGVPLEPTPEDGPPSPDCLLGVWEAMEPGVALETDRILEGEVAPIEGVGETNESDRALVYWVVAWGVLERALQENVIGCGPQALAWAEANFRTAGRVRTPPPTGHGLNALRKVTAGWGPLPLERASAPTEGDYRAVLSYLEQVITAYLEEGGPYYLGPDRWIPPSLAR